MNIFLQLYSLIYFYFYLFMGLWVYILLYYYITIFIGLYI